MLTQSSNKWYTLIILTLVYALNHVDRQVMVLLQVPIQKEFNLSETQLGLLTGLLFAVFYATLAIPFAVWSDRGNRRNIISLCLAIWSGMTVVSGFAQNFWQLAVARMGVGIGEAGGTPPATSMISDVFPPQRRAFALGIYTSGIALGILVGFVLSGYVAEHWGWNRAFFVAGVPGLVVSIVLMTTVKEPIRGFSEKLKVTEDVPSFAQTIRFFMSQRALVSLLLGGVLVCISANAFLVGIPRYLMRVHDVPIGALGRDLGLLMGGLGGIGAITIGALCDRLSRNDTRWRPWTILITGLIALPFTYWFLVAPDKSTAYWAYVVPGLFGLLYASISYTAMQELAPVRMRAMASAIMLFCLTLLGIGLGPVIVGLISDHFTQAYGKFAIQKALICMLAFNIAAIVFYCDSARHYRAGVAKARAFDQD